MEGHEVVLTDMLACRERRVNTQNAYIQKYHCPVISFCMNIPGPIKTNQKSIPFREKSSVRCITKREHSGSLTD